MLRLCKVFWEESLLKSIGKENVVCLRSYVSSPLENKISSKNSHTRDDHARQPARRISRGIVFVS